MRSMTLLCMALFTCSTMAQPPKPKPIRAEIESLIQHTLPRADIGIALIDAQSGKMLYERNAYQCFTPASNTKVLTAVAALFELGPDYQYYTSVQLNTKKLHNKKLKGDLYIKFTGDPSFKIKHLKTLISQLKEHVTTIKGRVVIDNTRFEGPVYAPGWSQEDLNWYYNAPVSSVILNENTLDANIIPSARLGGQAKLSVVNDELAPYFQTKIDVETVTYPNAIEHCSLYPNLNDQNDISVTGCWPISDKAKTLHFAIKNPDLLAKKIIERELKQQHIQHGGIAFGKTPKNLEMIALHKSRELKSLVHTLLKDSNNIYAESLTKTLGKKIYACGSFQEGVNVINNILLDKANIDPKKWVLKDGSGASRYNLFSPKQLTRVLFVIHHTPSLSRLFRHALPESGEDGTLRSRMKSFDLKGKLFAKTGSMGGVSTLSGFLTTRDGHQLIFAIMMNHLTGKLEEARMLQAKIASVIYSGEPWE